MDNKYELNFAISATECMYTHAERVNCFNIYLQQLWETATMEAGHTYFQIETFIKGFHRALG
jgi:hypothetical protein